MTIHVHWSCDVNRNYIVYSALGCLVTDNTLNEEQRWWKVRAGICVFIDQHFLSSSSGIFGSSLLDSSPLSSPEPIADSDPGYHGNSTNPLPTFEVESVTSLLRHHGGGDDDVTHHSKSTPAAAASTAPPSSSQTTPTLPFTQPPDWLTSVTALTSAWPISTTATPDTGMIWGVKVNRGRGWQQRLMGNKVLETQHQTADEVWHHPSEPIKTLCVWTVGKRWHGSFQSLSCVNDAESLPGSLCSPLSDWLDLCM